jgi:UDP-N-acetylmuramoyl-tripeptide--D-alanyl-D-alanine ligase
MKEFLFSPDSKGVIFSIYHALVLLALIAFVLTQSVFDWSFILPSGLSIVFLAESLLFVSEILSKQAKRPRMTAKAFLIVVFTLAWEALLFGLFVWYAGRIDELMFSAVVLGVLMLLCHDLNALLVFAMAPVTGEAKKNIYRRARKKRRQMRDLITIGITGSYGKSSVKEFLTQLLETKYRVLQTEKNENSEIGVAKTILKKLTREHEVFVCEMGAYKRGEIATTCKIAQPTIAIETGINDQHLSLFGNQENIVKAKWELVESLPLNGFAVFNGDSELLRREINKHHGTSYICSFSDGDMVPANVKVKRDRVLFSLDGHELEAPLLGKFNVLNLTLAIAVARHLGVKWSDIMRVLKMVRPPDKTMQLEQVGRGYIIDDSYNTNADGMRAALEHMKLFRGFKKVVVFPGILELGETASKRHEELGEHIGSIADELLITAEKHAAELEQGAKDKGMTRHHIHTVLDQRKLTEVLDKVTKKQKTVVLFESRGGEKGMEWLRKC